MDVDAVQPVGDTDTDIGNMDDILAETEIRLEEVIGSDLASLSDGNESPICTTVEKNESSSELDASEKENYERFCAFAEQIAPNKSIWEDVYHLRTTPFSQDELPFQQKTFMFGLQPQHILAIPFLKSAGTLLLSTFTLFVLVVNYHTANVEHYRASRLIFSSTLIVTPLLGIGWIPYLYEHPCRLLLYYRLWEHKVVINFKNRDLSDRTTRVKLALCLGSFALCVAHGCLYDPIAPFSFFLVAAQTIGTTASVIYSSMDLETDAIAVNRALENYLHNNGTTARMEETQQANTAEAVPSPNKLFKKTVDEISFVPERQVKHDLMVVNRHRIELYYGNSKVFHANYKEKLAWLSNFTLFIGRLGNTKENVRGMSFSMRELYAFMFVQHMYDDAFWHKHGSFAKVASRTGRVNNFNAILATIVIILLVAFSYAVLVVNIVYDLSAT